MFGLSAATTVYVHRAPIDFRKNINGLAALVENNLHLNPFAASCFVFRNKRADKIKLLFWQKNGFWLCQKRLEQDRFVWPKAESTVIAPLEVRPIVCPTPAEEIEYLENIRLPAVCEI